MRSLEQAERQIRDLGRNIVPPTLKRQLWFYYVEGKRIMETQQVKGFGQVRVEVNTHCNQQCWYCDNSRLPKLPKFIDIKLFQKIADDLEFIGYRGRFSPNVSSEPLLHPKLEELITIARKIKHARIVIYTNGDFLDRKKFDALNEAGVDEYIITQHGTTAPKDLVNLMHSLSADENKKVRYQTLSGVHLFNRGIAGLIPPERRAIPNPCFLVDELTILVDGKVTQCGNDAQGRHIFGDVNQNSIITVWNDENYKTFRRQVHRGQFKSAVCQRCVFDRDP